MLHYTYLLQCRHFPVHLQRLSQRSHPHRTNVVAIKPAWAGVTPDKPACILAVSCMRACFLAPTHTSVVTVPFTFSASANAAAPIGPILLPSRLRGPGGGVLGDSARTPCVCRCTPLLTPVSSLPRSPSAPEPTPSPPQDQCYCHQDCVRGVTPYKLACILAVSCMHAWSMAPTHSTVVNVAFVFSASANAAAPTGPMMLSPRLLGRGRPLISQHAF